MSKPREQYGALPFRIVNGEPQILLATSRETKRWVIPKGWPMKKTPPHRAAAREAFEEAGVKGEIGRWPIGSYGYEKRLRDGAVVQCRVEVFPMRADKQARRWPEYEERQTSWFAPEDAAAAVIEPELAQIIRNFAAAVAKAV